MNQLFSKELIECVHLALLHFDDYQKTSEWFSTQNPSLGQVSPAQMVMIGRTEILLKFIQNLVAKGE